MKANLKLLRTDYWNYDCLMYSSLGLEYIGVVINGPFFIDDEWQNFWGDFYNHWFQGDINFLIKVVSQFIFILLIKIFFLIIIIRYYNIYYFSNFIVIIVVIVNKKLAM